MDNIGNGGKYGDPGPGFSVINKFGENADIDTATTPETVWSQGGVFPFLDTGIAMDLVSTDAADDIDSGTGAQSVRLTRYDDTNNEIKEDFDLEGLTRVQVPGLVKLGSRIEILTSGAVMSNVGRLLLVDRATGAVIYQAVEIGEGQTLSTPQMCPAGKKGLVTLVYATYARILNRSNAQLKFRLRRVNGTILTKWPTTISTDNPYSEKDYKSGGVEVAAGEVVYWECTSVTANDTPIEAGFDIQFEDI